jgi:pantothenate kinase type III
LLHRAPPPDLVRAAVVAPRGDTLTQLGVDVRASLSGLAQIRTLRIVVDSGTATERVYPWEYDG